MREYYRHCGEQDINFENGESLGPWEGGMKRVTHSLVIAAEDHLLSGEPISRFESLALYGVPDG